MVFSDQELLLVLQVGSLPKNLESLSPSVKEVTQTNWVASWEGPLKWHPRYMAKKHGQWWRGVKQDFDCRLKAANARVKAGTLDPSQSALLHLLPPTFCGLVLRVLRVTAYKDQSYT